MNSPLAPLLALALAAPLCAQTVLHKTLGTGLPGENGFALAAAGDVSGDGLEDYWMSAPNVSDGFGGCAVLLCSGADGATLRTLSVAEHDEHFGFALAAGRDLSGDGVPDVLVGAPQGAGAVLGSGLVRAFSGADGALLFEVPGATAAARFGAALAFLDDVDGDGVPDFAVGAPGDDQGGSERGSVRACSGADGATLGVLRGAASGDQLGAALARAGDADGDGWSELLAGAPGTAASAGAVWVVDGRGRSLVTVLGGSAAGERLGHSVAAAGDVDGDGLDDWLAGAPGAHAARVFSAASGAELWRVARTRSEGPPNQPLAEGGFGAAVSGAGDLDGDGHADFAVGYPAFSGVWLFSGADASVLGLYASSFTLHTSGEITSAYLGWALAQLGDLDGDGRGELVAGAPFDSLYGDFMPGSAAVLAGGFDARWRLAGENGALVALSSAGDLDADGRDDAAYSSGFELTLVSGRDASVLRTLPVGGARALSPAGDVDADGVTDLVVGQPFEDGGHGRARVYSGATGAELLVLEPQRVRPRRLRAHDFPRPDLFGTSVAGVGDLDGDGHADLAVGAPRAPHPTECLERFRQEGYVAVFSGATGARLHLFVGEGLQDLYGEPWSEAFGFSVAGCGDWNRDGVPDVAVGAPGGGAHFGGVVRVFSGATGRELLRYAGSGGEFGIALSGAADFDADGDGWVDLVVGSQSVGYGPFVEASGIAWVVSSRTGTWFHAVAGTPPPRGYGRSVGPAYSVAALRDFDGDGRSDFALGNPAAQGLLGRGVGEVTVHSGVDAHVLARVGGSSSWDYLGYSIAAAGDADGDGKSDLLVLAPATESPRSLARARLVLSGP